MSKKYKLTKCAGSIKLDLHRDDFDKEKVNDKENKGHKQLNWQNFVKIIASSLNFR